MTGSELDKNIEMCYNRYVTMLQQTICDINKGDKEQHSDPNEAVYFFMRDALRCRKCIAYYLMDLHKTYSGEAIIAKDDKTYLHSFESCTDPKKALKDDKEALVYQEELIRNVQKYVKIEDYEPSLIYAFDANGKRTQRYMAAGFYDDLRLFYDLYRGNVLVEMKRDKEAFGHRN